MAFSLAASSIYILNDYKDLDTDRLHPTKKDRPLASGKAKISISLVLMTLLATIALTIAFNLDLEFLLLLSIYLAINVGYSLGLKDVAILDIILVASGFLFRIYSGSIISEVATSHWLALMVMLLALFLALAKRRDDLVIGKDKTVLRKSSQNYNLEFINSCLTLFAGVIIVCYIMYSVSPEVTERLDTKWLFTTTIFVLAGIMRYLQITFVESNSGSPSTLLLKDKFLLITLAGWILSFYLILYIR
jgi:decaprenyl-phosphate phosphoribosyltransferase